MSTAPVFPHQALDAAGLNRQAIIDLAALPADLRARLAAVEPLDGYRQLILIGHGGPRLWTCVQAAGLDSPDPIDDYTRQTVHRCLDALPGIRYHLLYPGECPLDLQRLGQLAGWHHPSPFMVGIDAHWGSWSAYRALLLANTRFPPTARTDHGHPCPDCTAKPCLPACPAGAIGAAGFNLAACLEYRKQPGSACRLSCQARLACPIGREHRYPDEQIAHSYAISLRMIETWS